MKKVSISIQEVVRYQRSMVIEIPDDMSESKLNTILDKAQRRSQQASDVPFIIEDLDDNVNVLEIPDEDMSSPWDTEVEIDDFDYIE